ncbi:hypothetical protein J2Z22_001906 [Paenibacillus forsythiae]|uniref:Uncharacterized protein n=1 Tax=Paenibacillus forsythiae TaxID=365616 RepID=A0ABU3H6M5_9BACL|nr:hypothetical protein [Paenibacillus forsythiae]MDT3426380.1 hypothetical protein [Paenibacillus forsythiae]
MKNITARNQPAMHKISRMSYNEAFCSRSVEKQLEEYIAFFKEDFAFVLKKLEERFNGPVVAEGNQLLPSLVFPHLQPGHKAIWMIPAERFQRHHYSKRSWIKDILDCTDDPAAAFDNWMTRDARFAEYVEQEAKALNLGVLKVDGSQDLQATIDEIEEYFGPAQG